MTAAASADGLIRRFGDVVALSGLTFEAPLGKVFGLLGHNGAGKTTMIRVFNGLIAPSGGSCRVLGMDPTTDGERIRSRTGVLTETPALDSRLTGRENLSFFADFFDMDRARARRRIDFLIDAFDLGAREGELVATYSRGMHQRLALARAMLHEPELLFLDEPTSGLDPVAIRLVHLMINAFRSDGGAVFLCTHNLEEAERLCDVIAVLERGKIIAIGDPADLMARVSNQQLEIEIGRGHEVAACEAVRTAIPAAKPTAVGAIIRVDGVPRDRIPAVVDALANARIPVFRVTPRIASLEDVYFALHEAGGDP